MACNTRFAEGGRLDLDAGIDGYLPDCRERQPRDRPDAIAADVRSA